MKAPRSSRGAFVWGMLWEGLEGSDALRAGISPSARALSRSEMRRSTRWSNTSSGRRPLNPANDRFGSPRPFPARRAAELQGQKWTGNTFPIARSMFSSSPSLSREEHAVQPEAILISARVSADAVPARTRRSNPWRAGRCWQVQGLRRRQRSLGTLRHTNSAAHQSSAPAREYSR